MACWGILYQRVSNKVHGNTLKRLSRFDLEVQRVNYSFKTGTYFAYVRSQTSLDTHFDLDISLAGKILRDSYENHVLSGWNTWQRIDSEYRIMVDKVFMAPDFPYVSPVNFGSIQTIESDREVDPLGRLWISIEDLELDKKYDVRS